MENDLATKAQREREINVMMIMMTHYTTIQFISAHENMPIS